jgi:hypothetical protein
MTQNYSRDQYLRNFCDGKNSKGLQREAWKQAHESREFEADLYWKQAAYFWALIAATFAGYVALQKDGDIARIYTIECLGFIFSLGWYFAIRGSNARQQNWDMHVDLLENEISGPLYKFVLRPYDYRLRDLIDAFPFSVSKINQVLSLFVTTVWVVLIARTFVMAERSTGWSWSWSLFSMTAITLAGIATLFRATTNFSEELVQVKIKKRTYPTDAPKSAKKASLSRNKAPRLVSRKRMKDAPISRQ